MKIKLKDIIQSWVRTKKIDELLDFIRTTVEKPESKPEKRKVRAELSFGLPGHEWEYTFVLDSDDYLTSEIGELLESELGEDWSIFDRGSRIEIKNKKQLGLRDDAKIKSAVVKAVADKYSLRIVL